MLPKHLIIGELYALKSTNLGWIFAATSVDFSKKVATSHFGTRKSEIRLETSDTLIFLGNVHSFRVISPHETDFKKPLRSRLKTRLFAFISLRLGITVWLCQSDMERLIWPLEKNVAIPETNAKIQEDQ